MAKIKRDFFSRERWEQRWLLENTWCELCRQADLGMTDPSEYEENGQIIVEGRCQICGSVVNSVIEDKEIRDKQ